MRFLHTADWHLGRTLNEYSLLSDQKERLQQLIDTAKEQKVDAALFGHTHRPYCEKIDGIWFLNPGSVGSYCCADYAVITVENGTMNCVPKQKK